MEKSRKETNVYQLHGFSNREEYLQHLSEDHGIPIDTVILIAEVLGPEEDFDGLVSNLIYSQEDF